MCELTWTGALINVIVVVGAWELTKAVMRPLSRRFDRWLDRVFR